MQSSNVNSSLFLILYAYVTRTISTDKLKSLWQNTPISSTPFFVMPQWRFTNHFLNPAYACILEIPGMSWFNGAQMVQIQQLSQKWTKSSVLSNIASTQNAATCKWNICKAPLNHHPVDDKNWLTAGLIQISWRNAQHIDLSATKKESRYVERGWGNLKT